MKKTKKIFLAFAFCLAFAFTGVTAGCKDGAQDSTSSSSSSVEESFVGVRFSVSQVEIAQYESVNLDYKVKGTTSAVEFSSSDETIVTVDENGRVTAKGVIGNAVITAKVDGVSSTCTVCVKKTTISPSLVLGTTAYNLETGETIQFKVEAEWNKEILKESFACEAVVEDSQNVQSTVSVNGKEISLVAGNKAEEFSVIISATVRGEYTSERITVRVEESRLKIRATNMAFVPAKGGYAAQISTTDEVGDMANRVSLDFAVGKGSEIFNDADISWTLEGDSATLDGNELVGEKSGAVILNGTATINGETANVKIFCDVVAPEVHLEDTGVLEVENLQTITLNTPLIGDFINAELHGKEVSTFKSGQKISFRENKDNFPKEARLLGNQKLVLNTNKVRYTMDVTIYTMIINDADELDKMATLANTGATEVCQAKNSTKYGKEVDSQYFDGYFVLGNDITYNREFVSMTNTNDVWQVTGTELDYTRGFKGIFDGMGYNIEGMTVGMNEAKSGKASGGMFGFLPYEGIVKNVSFTNATMLTNSGFICSMGDGTVENVSIQYKKIGDNSKSTHETPAFGYRAMGSFFSIKCGPNATVKNCLVDASTAEISYARTVAKDGTFVYDVCLAGMAPHTSNVVVVSSNNDLLGYSGGDIQRNSYVELQTESEDLFSRFDKTIWTIKQGLPMFVNQANAIDVNKEIQFRDSVDSVLVVGFDMPIIVDYPYTQISIDKIEGVVLKNNVLSATNTAYGKEVTITATSLLNPENKATYTIYIDSFGTKTESPVAEISMVYDNNPVLVLGDNSWLWGENYLYYGKEIVGEGNAQTGGIVIDVEKFGYGTKAVTVVRDADGTREYFTADVTMWHVSADINEKAVKVADSALGSTHSSNPLTKYEGTDDTMVAPTGFNSVTRFDTEKPKAMWMAGYNTQSLSIYNEVWFAIKVVNGILETKGKALTTNSWIYFHLTQTGNSVWTIEITVNGEVYQTQTNQSGTEYQNTSVQKANSLATILYGNSYQSEDGEYVILNNNSGATMTLYATEIMGYAIPWEPEISKEAVKVAASALGSNTHASNPLTKYEGVDDTAVPAGFTKVTRYDSKDTWTSSVMHPCGYDNTSIAKYDEVWFALKSNGSWNITNNKDSENSFGAFFSDSWIYFHLTQKSDSVWDIEITKDGKVITLSNQSGIERGYGSDAMELANALSTILYGKGAAQGNTDGASVILYRGDAETLNIYSTEVMGKLAGMPADNAKTVTDENGDTVWMLRDGASDDSTHEYQGEYTMAVPTGFTQVKRFDSNTEAGEDGALWNTARAWATSYDDTDLSAYSEVWFAVCISSGYIGDNQNPTIAFSGTWAYFHLTQTAESLWTIEVVVNGEVKATYTDHNAKSGSATLPKDSIAKIIYNTGSKGQGVYLWVQNGACSIYSTELVGILKTAEVDPENV